MTQTIEFTEPELTAAQGSADTATATPGDERDNQLEAETNGAKTFNGAELEEAKALVSSTVVPATQEEKSENASQQSQQPAKHSNLQTGRATVSNQTSDPIESEPYRWHECTVGINIQLIPDAVNKEHYETAIIGVRTHNDTPIIKRVAAKELLPLPECIKELIREMREQLPARDEHRAERLARAAKQAAKPSLVKAQPAKTKVKPGRYIAAQSTGAQKEAIEQEAFDDDLFSSPPMCEQAEATDASNDGEDFAEDFPVEVGEKAAGGNTQEQHKSRLPAPLTNRTARREKYDKRGRLLKEKPTASPQNQMSLIK
ncbi:MAG: hypothetical protein ACR2G4_14015 [Pyrinomonadaceae bacterium]